MTFDQWYEDRLGFRVTQAERDNHKQLRNYRDCWESAISCAKADHEAALAARDDQWATAIAKFTPYAICKKIADEMSARGDK